MMEIKAEIAIFFPLLIGFNIAVALTPRKNVSKQEVESKKL